MAVLSTGSEFAGYRIEGIAGQGGMGVVYKATQLALGRNVALKLIASELAHDAGFRERFKSEAELAASIDHPNVIPIYEAGESEGRLFLSMRFVEGTDLSALIASEDGLETEHAVSIVAQVGAALDAAHALGLVHRDVKPANVLISSEGHVYLTDFGLTKRTTAAGGPTKTGQFVGTIDYVAPEQIKGEPADARADVYALGCVLFHALAGTPPFARDSDVAKIYAHLNDDPPALAPGTTSPPALDTVVRRAMAKEPDQRYPSTGDFGRAAKAALEETAPRGVERSVATGAASPGGPSTTDSGDPALKRRARLAVAVGLPVLLLAGVVAAVLAATGVIGGDDGGGASGGGGAAGGEATEAGTGQQAAGGGTPKPIASIRVGDGPDGVAVDADNGQVFVSNQRDDTLVRIDAESNEPIGEPLPLGNNPDQVVVEKGTLWATSTNDGTVRRFEVDPDPVESGTLRVGRAPVGISLGKQLVWVVNSGDGTVSRLDRATPDVVGGPIGVGAKPIAVFVGAKTVWVTNSGDDTVTRIDPATSEQIGEPIDVGDEPRGVVEGFGSAWVSNSLDGTVTRINTKTGKVSGRPIQVGRNPRDIAVGEGSVWVSNSESNTVSRIDPGTGQVQGQEISVGNRPLGIAVGAGAIWVANNRSDTVTKIVLER